ncbi:uncharacterized protein LOC110033347 [Phalaenopsis equestris]|uniref:uncharacterized protein LOC110033347 n=1 Tax=Phalaenopsis equestris TaxID=78828 RepID=UPI0009E1E9ED|nr:uncharacterized protein LOC110033347 [Phalaenopsis equestris]
MGGVGGPLECCYNFTEDRHGNPPGILRYDEVDSMPSEIKRMIKRLVRWSILLADCIPKSCIINIYDEGDCIPPHIKHNDFVRPFCTVSFMSKSNILFGKEINVICPGEFKGPVKILLSMGSVLILKGNGADLAKHCILGVRHHKASVTIRGIDDSQLDLEFTPQRTDRQSVDTFVLRQSSIDDMYSAMFVKLPSLCD